jgi:hypothetical protein
MLHSTKDFRKLTRLDFLPSNLICQSDFMSNANVSYADHSAFTTSDDPDVTVGADDKSERRIHKGLPGPSLLARAKSSTSRLACCTGSSVIDHWPRPVGFVKSREGEVSSFRFIVVRQSSHRTKSNSKSVTSRRKDGQWAHIRQRRRPGSTSSSRTPLGQPRG